MTNIPQVGTSPQLFFPTKAQEDAICKSLRCGRREIYRLILSFCRRNRIAVLLMESWTELKHITKSQINRILVTLIRDGYIAETQYGDNRAFVLLVPACLSLKNAPVFPRKNVRKSAALPIRESIQEDNNNAQDAQPVASPSVSVVVSPASIPDSTPDEPQPIISDVSTLSPAETTDQVSDQVSDQVAADITPECAPLVAELASVGVASATVYKMAREGAERLRMALRALREAKDVRNAPAFVCAAWRDGYKPREGQKQARPVFEKAPPPMSQAQREAADRARREVMAALRRR